MGVAIATGLVWLDQNVTIFNEGDVTYRASRGNVGMVWVQGKGADMHDVPLWLDCSLKSNSNEDGH